MPQVTIAARPHRSLLTAALLLAAAARAQGLAAAPPAAAASAAPEPSAPATAPLPVPVVGPEAFQGLPWGATEIQLLERFGTRLQPAACDSAARRDAAARDEVCDHPVLPLYPVAGLPFRLSLHLDAARTLRKVTLSYAGDAPASGYAADSRWGEKHRVLRMLLTQRYGAPESTHIDNESGAYTASARWRRGETLIDLRSMFLHGATASGMRSPAREHFDITYLPVTAGDAGKL
jgi:hypothetical protein